MRSNVHLRAVSAVKSLFKRVVSLDSAKESGMLLQKIVMDFTIATIIVLNCIP